LLDLIPKIYVQVKPEINTFFLLKTQRLVFHSQIRPLTFVAFMMVFLNRIAAIERAAVLLLSLQSSLIKVLRKRVYTQNKSKLKLKS